MSTPVVRNIVMLGERLKEERLRLEMSQDEFAQHADGSRRALIEWEKGNTSPTAFQLENLAALGVDVLYVVTGNRSARVRYATNEDATRMDIAEPLLGSREYKLLAAWRSLDEAGKKAVEQMVKALSKT